MEPARFVIASGPTPSRLWLANLVGEEYDGRVAVKAYDHYKDEYYSGVTTDYRFEIAAAGRYATDMLRKRDSGLPVIYSHSLLDSLAYAALKVERYFEHNAVSQETKDKALMVFAVTGAMFKDTFKADEVLFLNIFEEGDNGYDVQVRIEMILDEFEIPYHALGGSPMGLDIERDDIRKATKKILDPYLETEDMDD